MSIHRRSFMIGAAAVTTTLAKAEAAHEIINLWPGMPPDGTGPSGPEVIGPNGGHQNITTPRLEVWRPAQPNGAAVLVVAGGGYRRIGIEKEAQPAATWLNSIGVTAFILYYRLPGEGSPRAAPFQDGQRAMRIMRSRAASMGLDPAHIGILGFSAGGHLAGMTAMRPAAQLYDPVDATDGLSARPDFAGLIYPVLTLLPPYITAVSTKSLLGDTPSMAQREAYSIERLVDPDAPPVFLVHANDDTIAPAENSLFMYAALRHAHVPAALHIFRTGGHGFNIGASATELHLWPPLFANWAGLA